MIFFDVAETLLVKKEIPNIFSRFLQADLDESEVLQSVRRVFDSSQIPDHPGKDFYLNFNKTIAKNFGCNLSDEDSYKLTQEIKKLNWGTFDDKEKDFINSLPIDAGIISNWGSNLRVELSNHFSKKFKSFIISSEVGVQKPSVEIYLRALESVKSQSPIYVGDSLRLDINPAKDVGFDAILIDRFNYYPSYSGKKISRLWQLEKYI